MHRRPQPSVAKGWVVAPLLIAMLLGCASEVYRTPTPFTAASSERQHPTLRVREPLNVTLSTGYTRLIRQNSTWGYVGTTPQGAVYRPIDGVFAIEGANMHEAYLVMANDELVGFYLPGEGAFAPLPGKIRLITE
jgi:hypothetical protein